MIISGKKLKVHLISILIAVGVGALAGFLTRNGMTAFEALKKPSLTPPSAVFPIVWTVLYVLMGISSAMIYQSDSPGRRNALIFYAAQLAVNFFWTIFFFSLKAYWFSFFWLLLLLGLIIVMVVTFWKINKSAALLQLPYLLWVFFAGYLNLMIALLNRT
ncbi:TspO/MBR family protein [Caproicibacter fermentans]|uniref:Tryptophan-rich sensory protein n=1 Tax=Caproicibacter fermentans TaxID=2576756 RepID=A0A7G8TDF3_9FIRM|nr:TspO/MBR family protein [Caproicibacter fermentans]QNK41644.1 tryptophan-rich sensory protein [Caproicibacter fermentans]